MQDNEIGEIQQTRSKSLMGVEIEIIVSVGKSKMSLSELVKLENESVLRLDSKIDDSVEIFVGNKMIARGELEIIEGDPELLGVRLTEVADLSSGI